MPLSWNRSNTGLVCVLNKPLTMCFDYKCNFSTKTDLKTAFFAFFCISALFRGHIRQNLVYKSRIRPSNLIEFELKDQIWLNLNLVSNSEIFRIILSRIWNSSKLSKLAKMSKFVRRITKSETWALNLHLRQNSSFQIVVVAVEKASESDELQNVENLYFIPSFKDFFVYCK